MHNNNMNEAKKLLLFQGGLLVLISLLLLLFDKNVAISGLLGGLIAFVSSLVMFLLMFRKYRAQQPEKILVSFYAAEMVKLIFAMAAFAVIVLNVKPLSFATLILVFFIIQVLPALLINNR